jgi:hypothetical protein
MTKLSNTYFFVVCHDEGRILMFGKAREMERTSKTSDVFQFHFFEENQDDLLVFIEAS